MKILISSGIYPPDIGGPAQYARNLYEVWKTEGHGVKVAAYRWERVFPPLFRHLLFLIKVIRKGWNADLILVLDTWSAAVPTNIACKLMRKKYILRTGGDALWESYVERTGNMVLFREFYDSKSVQLSWKERLMFSWGKSALRNAKALIFSTQWQKGIFEKVYGLDAKKEYIVENYCGPRETSIEPENRTFLGSTREIKWKNLDLLREAFKVAQSRVNEQGLVSIDLDTSKAMYQNFVERMRRAYAVILVSIGDISPNMIFDAIRLGVPFIVTKENGINDLIKDAAIFVDPLNPQDITEKIVWLADPKNRALQAAKVQKIHKVHTWENIGKEIIEIWKKIE